MHVDARAVHQVFHRVVRAEQLAPGDGDELAGVAAIDQADERGAAILC